MLDFGLFGRFALTDDRMRDFCLSGQGLARDWFVPIPGSLQIPSRGGRPWLSALPLSSSARHSERQKPDDHTSVIGLLITTTACVAHRGIVLNQTFPELVQRPDNGFVRLYEDRDGIAGKQDKERLPSALNADIQAPVDCILGADGGQIAAETNITTGSGATHMLRRWRYAFAVVRYGFNIPENECKPGHS